MPARSVPATLKRRRTEQELRNKGVKKFKKTKRQRHYHSSSEEESEEEDQSFAPVNLLDDDEDNAAPPKKDVPPKQAAPKAKQATPKAKSKEVATDAPESEDDDMEDAEVGAAAADEDNDDEESGSEGESYDEEGSDAESDASTGGAPPKKRKRNDPDAFATSMSKILGSKLSTAKRQDPVLARSKDAAEASKEVAESKVEAKARSKLKEEKRAALEKGRVKDVLGLDDTETSTAVIQEQERRLKKTAQRGVVKLFNAVRAAQVKAEQAAAEARRSGVVGIQKREEKVSEMSKKGFLDMIAGGGKKPAATAEA